MLPEDRSKYKYELNCALAKIAKAFNCEYHILPVHWKADAMLLRGRQLRAFLWYNEGTSREHFMVPEDVVYSLKRIVTHSADDNGEPTIALILAKIGDEFLWCNVNDVNERLVAPTCWRVIRDGTKVAPGGEGANDKDGDIKKEN